MMSPQRVTAIAGNTVREAVRNKVLYVLLFFALVLISTGVLLSALSYVERDRILQDVGLASIRMFGVAMAIFLGVGLIHKEVDRRTIYTVLSKPVSRAEFLVGKYLGLLVTLWLQVLVMGAGFAAVSLLADAPLTAGHATAIGLAGVEVALMGAIATLFSSFSTPILSGLFSIGLYLVGHLTRDLRELGIASGSESTANITQWLYRVLPDLESLNLSIQAVHGLPISAAEVGLALVYATAYIVGLLVLATLLFQRRDLR